MDLEYYNLILSLNEDIENSTIKNEYKQIIESLIIFDAKIINNIEKYHDYISIKRESLNEESQRLLDNDLTKLDQDIKNNVYPLKDKDILKYNIAQKYFTNNECLI